jgi:hypothetical protein
MTISKFEYLKEGTTEKKAYELLVINKDEAHVNGVALNYLKPEEREAVLALVLKYEEDLKPYMKSYRSFKKTGMILEEVKA